MLAAAIQIENVYVDYPVAGHSTRWPVRNSDGVLVHTGRSGIVCGIEQALCRELIEEVLRKEEGA